MSNPYKTIYELRETIAELSERCREQEADIEELLKEREKIVRSNSDLRRLSSIAEGGVFVHQTNLWLKTNEVIDDKITCVRLVDGRIEWFNKATDVYKRDAKVVLE